MVRRAALVFASTALIAIGPLSCSGDDTIVPLDGSDAAVAVDATIFDAPAIDAGASADSSRLDAAADSSAVSSLVDAGEDGAAEPDANPAHDCVYVSGQYHCGAVLLNECKGVEMRCPASIAIPADCTAACPVPPDPGGGSCYVQPVETQDAGNGGDTVMIYCTPGGGGCCQG